MAEQPPATKPEAACDPALKSSEPSDKAGPSKESATEAATPAQGAAESSSKSPAVGQGSEITHVKLPQGWEGLSIKLHGNKVLISEVPKACFSSNLKVADGTIRNQVDGVAIGDEVVTFNGEAPARVIERISAKGDAWNACSTMTPPHEVGTKTKFDSPPCAACDFIRRRKALGFDVALQMWLRAVKRDIQFTLGVRPAAAVTDDASGPSLNPTAAESAEPVKRMELRSLDDFKEVSTVVTMKASAESADRMEKAMERLQKLAELDDKTRDKKYKQAAKGKGKDKGAGKGKRPTGPYLERTRLTDSLVTGVVDEWKGKYGWIKPHKPVDHSKAGAHKGRLYVHQVDLEWWVKSLTKGSFCRFHVYSDANSLGAEECTELKESSGNDDDDLGPPPGNWGSSWGNDSGWQSGYGDRARSRSPRK